MNSGLDNSVFMNTFRHKHFEFIDFGCSEGGTLRFGSDYLSDAGIGLGIDIDSKKVAKANSLGYDAIVYDIHSIPNDPLVSFTTMSHFLEHVPSRYDVQAFIRKAAVISKDFVFIRQPWFDSDVPLYREGLKLYWSDWSGHPSHLTTFDMSLMLRKVADEGLIREFAIYGRGVIGDSSHPCVHPITSGVDQHAYDAETHPLKPEKIRFDFPVYRELVAVARISSPLVAVSAPESYGEVLIEHYKAG